MQKKKIRLKEKQIEKAKEIEREAMKDMDLFPDDKGDEQRRFRNMMEELREKGLLTEEEERQIFGEGGHLEQQKMPLRVEGEYQESPDLHKNTSWRRLGRVAAMFAMVLAGIFAACMTSEANRRTVMDAVGGWMGGNARVMVYDNEGNSDRAVPEDEARMTIENELGVQVPYMVRRPSEMVFKEYEFYPEAGFAVMYYSLDNTTLTLQIVTDKTGKKGASTLNGELVAEVRFSEEDINAEVYREENSNGARPTINARWEFNNTYYQFGGNVDEEVFERILKNFWY